MYEERNISIKTDGKFGSVWEGAGAFGPCAAIVFHMFDSAWDDYRREYPLAFKEIGKSEDGYKKEKGRKGVCRAWGTFMGSFG